MSFTLGMDLGIVMAKGVVLGVICCVTVLPSLLLVFDKAIEKTKHKVIIPDLGRIADWIVRHYGVFPDRISGGVGPGSLRLHTRMCITILREHCRRA